MTDCREPKGEAFGLERIKNTFERLAKHNAQQICNNLLRRLQISGWFQTG
jgi:serine phosphatase RsbU (regulator of sigma subunit)